MTSSRAGRAMGTDVGITVVGGTLDADALFDRVLELEQRWSRFLPSSELSELNRAEGEPTVVSEDTITLVTRMTDAFQLTGRRFDPTLLDAMVDLGYSATFDELTAAPTVERSTPPGMHRHPSLGPLFGARLRTDHPFGHVEIDTVQRTVRLPAGLHLDPGGIGKGLAADLVCDAATAAGATGILVDVGGDIACRGAAPDDGPWRVAVSWLDIVVQLHDGAIATSEITARAWVHDGRQHHHLLDPYTAQSLVGVASATAIAGAAWWAEAMTKAALVSTARDDGWLNDERAEELGVSVTVGTTGAARRRLRRYGPVDLMTATDEKAG